MMKIAAQNPALTTASAKVIAPKFMQLVRTAIDSGTYSDKLAMSRREPAFQARNISLNTHSGSLQHRIELYLTPFQEVAVVNFDFSALNNVQTSDEPGFTFLGYAEYGEISDVKEGERSKQAALTRELFKMSVDDVMALAVRHNFGLAKGIEIFLNAPH